MRAIAYAPATTKTPATTLGRTTRIGVGFLLSRSIPRAPGLGRVDERHCFRLFEVAERRERDHHIDGDLPEQREAAGEVRALDRADDVDPGAREVEVGETPSARVSSRSITE